MSLLGLLDIMPEAAAQPGAPVFPSLEFKTAEPLTMAETERWNEIVERLGDLPVHEQMDEDPPIWRELSAKYATLLLGPEPALGEMWGGDDWIAKDFEDAWAMATPIWNGMVAPQTQGLFLDPENAPPRAFRSPTETHHDRTNLPDDAFERILEGLRRL